MSEYEKREVQFQIIKIKYALEKLIGPWTQIDREVIFLRGEIDRLEAKLRDSDQLNFQVRF